MEDTPETVRMATLKGVKAWLKAHPIARRPLVPSSSQVATEEAIRALVSTTAGGAKQVKTVELEGVSPLLLMKPVTEGSLVDLYAGGDFELGDRVVMVGDSGQPSFGSRGAIVAVHSYMDAHSQDAHAESVEVLFDDDFVGGNDLHGVISGKRGAMLPVAQLINLSHPPAMPNLGSAAPKVVVKVEKGDMDTPTKWSERAPRIQRDVVPQPTLPEKGTKGFASAKGAGRGKAKQAPEPGALPTNMRMLSMLDSAAEKSKSKVAAPSQGKKAPMSVAELEAQMLQMMGSPAAPKGSQQVRPGKKENVGGTKKSPISIKELEASLLAGASAQPPLPPGAPPNLKESPKPARMPKTKKPVAAVSPQPALPPGMPPPAPSSGDAKSSTESKSEPNQSGEAEPADAPKPKARMIPRFLLRGGK